MLNGEIDANGFGAMEKAVAQPFTGTYSIGADNRGVMSLNIPGGGTLALAMMANGNAKFVEIDAGGGHASNGRTDIRAATGYAAAYLVSFNEAFFILPDSCVSSGFGEPQTPGTITNSSIAGNYAGSTAIPTNVKDVIFSGEFTADRASPTGNISGTEDIGAPSGPSLAVPANATYSVSISSTFVVGKGWWYVNGSRAGIIYVISPSKFVVQSWDPSGYESLLIFEH